MNHHIKLAPSILAADFARLGEQVQEAERADADMIHVDVMDGCFVPNISIGAPVVAALRPLTRLPLDVHLMIVEPDRHLEAFAKAGADGITVHVETCPHLHRTIQAIHELGIRAGVTLNPATPLVTLEEILTEVELVLIMSVNPGFGGQAFLPASLAKIRRLREMLHAVGSSADIQVDGGVKIENAGAIARAGATILVAGTAIFNPTMSVPDALSQMRARVASDVDSW